MFPQVKFARNYVLRKIYSYFSSNNLVILIVMEGGKAVGPISEVEWVVVNSISDDFSESNSSSSSSIDMVDDDISSSFGPLYELSQLMAQLPIKRGLSKYYEGKSRSFGRLGSVMSLQDVAKEGKRMKSSKSITSSFAPKPTIKKKSYSTKHIL
ncbi:hypothetical protein AABB24_009593 [Solanum stoloniferum]|uniref:Uncharacterized protein n=1 Tax=Solanum stoloniferum TaxID=62892 RepID=A0ABD2UJ93_9SOLN